MSIRVVDNEPDRTQHKGACLTPEFLYRRMQSLDRGEIALESLRLIPLTNIYLFCSYAYYEKDVSLLSDGTFDKLCKYLYDMWEFMEAEGVWHLGTLILEDNLKAGTCLRVTYPPAVQVIADMMIELKQLEDL